MVRKDLQMEEDYWCFTWPEEFRIKGRWKHFYWCYNVGLFQCLGWRLGTEENISL